MAHIMSMGTTHTSFSQFNCQFKESSLSPNVLHFDFTVPGFFLRDELYNYYITKLQALNSTEAFCLRLKVTEKNTYYFSMVEALMECQQFSLKILF